MFSRHHSELREKKISQLQEKLQDRRKGGAHTHNLHTITACSLLLSVSVCAERKRLQCESQVKPTATGRKQVSSTPYLPQPTLCPLHVHCIAPSSAGSCRQQETGHTFSLAHYLHTTPVSVVHTIYMLRPDCKPTLTAVSVHVCCTALLSAPGPPNRQQSANATHHHSPHYGNIAP